VKTFVFTRVAQFVTLGSVAWLAGCSAAGNSPSVPDANAPASSQLSTRLQVVPGQRNRLYAIDAGGFPPTGPVYIFNEFGSHQKSWTHFGTFNSSAAMATDLAGNIYVTDEGTTPYDGKLYIYAKASDPPIRTIDDKGGLPAGVAVGNDGTIYLANAYDAGGCNDSGDVRVYGKGNSPEYVICDTGIGQPLSQLNGIAVDSKGDVYVSWEAAGYRSGLVREFTPGIHYVGHWLAPTLQWPFGLAVDAAGDVVVSEAESHTVEVFAPGSATPKYTFPQTGDPTGVVFDVTAKHLFVADALGNRIEEYEYPSGTLVNTVAFPGQQVDGIAVSPAWTGGK